MKSFSIQNFGCRVNQAEAFAWADALEQGGLRFEAEWGRSDIVLVNSCTLTRRADRDVRKFLQKVSRENPAACLVVTGCWSEAGRAEAAGLPGVLVVPNGDKDRLAETVLALAARTSSAADDVWQTAGRETGPTFRARAPVKVQDGCDDRCAFCVIPSVRGRSVSVGPADVAARVRDLVARGFREIVLAGIHLSSYGRDLSPRSSLLELLRELETIEGLGRLRLSSLDPRRLDQALRAHVAGSSKVCRHFHLSLQHASARVLREMGRAATPDAYDSLLQDLRARSPEASIGADIIVGFPGETDEDFASLRHFLEDSPLTYFHVFAYSPRPGTPAASRPQVPERIKKERSLALRRLSAEKSLRFRTGFAGIALDAVVIRKDRSGAELLTGNYFKVLVPFCPAPEREIVRVRVGRVLPGSLEGSVEA
jgi:threonylcarbamoyladenosine tRNA methylthiotransferase MtaB